MKIVRVAGTPFARGLAHGEQAREEIHEAIRVYRRWFETFARLSWEAARDAARAHRPWLENRDPAALEEMRGIAAGAGVPTTEIVALNFRTEIAYAAAGDLALTECTVLGVDASASGDGHVYLAQNWDWLTELLPLTIMLDWEFDGGRAVSVTEPGMLAKFGVNSAGVALCVNLLGSDAHGRGGSFHTLARRVLESATVLDATWAVTGSERAGSGNFLIGGASGELIDVEYNPVRCRLLFPANGTLAHANHFVGPDPGVRDRLDVLRGLSPGTYFRQWRAEQLLAAGPGAGLAGMQAILRDHYGAPESICRHPQPPGRREVLGQTNVSLIIDVTASALHYTLGCPCRSDYERISLPWA
ncbi:C45 family autoproteolytic acyltransferase/hydolase [Actinomadura craniellae]|nr:C45 family peptidase [Actinomadura craniellae]